MYPVPRIARILSAHLASLLLSWASLCSTRALAETRTWTDDTGKLSVEAELIEVNTDTAVLERASDGKKFRLPLQRLSLADQQYVKALDAEQNAVAEFKKHEVSIREIRHQPNCRGKPVFQIVFDGETMDFDACLKNMKALTKPIAFTLSGPDACDESMAKLQELDNLIALSVDAHRFNKFTNAGLEHLKGMTNLKDLYIDSDQVTDAGLEHLNGMVNLRGLAIYMSKVTDAGLKHLKGLSNLKGLNLVGTKITDAGLQHLEGLINLTSLQIVQLNDNKIKDAGLEHLRGLTELGVLNLAGAQIRGDGLKDIEGLTNLVDLVLDSTQVEDPGLEHLKRLANLKTLSLNSTNTTDAGLQHLSELGSLTRLNLRNTSVTETGKAELAKVLPKCEINL